MTVAEKSPAPLWFWLLTAMNGGAALALLLFTLAKIPLTRYWVDDGFVVLWCIAAFVSVPFGVVAVLVLRRRVGAKLAYGPKHYGRWSALFLTIAWLCLAPISLFWGAIYIHIWEPWPLSLAQGPDNERAREGFRRWLRVEPDASVHTIYYRVISFRDSSHYLRFGYGDPAMLQKIIATHDLVEMDAETRARRRLTYLGEDDTMADWWTAEEISATPTLYVDRAMYESLSQSPGKGASLGGMTMLWIDEARETAYFAYHTF